MTDEQDSDSRQSLLLKKAIRFRVEKELILEYQMRHLAYSHGLKPG